MNMIFKINVDAEIKLDAVKGLNKLKVIVVVNNLEKPNFNELSIPKLFLKFKFFINMYSSLPLVSLSTRFKFI